jgi:hypothetical protein
VGRAFARRPGARRRGDGAPLGAVRAACLVLERREGCEMWGEPRLRAAELEAERAIASAQLGHLPDGRPRLRRPDLVLFPPDAAPVAIEVELSVKGAWRLAAICRAWARCRIVGEVRYYAPPQVACAVPVPFPRFTPTTPSRSCRSRKP